jgi:hypothetical protein
MSFDRIELRLQESFAALVIDIRVPQLQPTGPIIFAGPEFPPPARPSLAALAEAMRPMLVVRRPDAAVS